MGGASRHSTGFGAAHGTAVDEERLVGAGGFCQLPHADQSVYAHAALAGIHVHHLLGGLLAVHGEHRVAQLAVAEAVEGVGPVVDEADGNIRIVTLCDL